MSLHSFATDVFFNDNLSQLSQEDYEQDFNSGSSSSESDN